MRQVLSLGKCHSTTGYLVAVLSMVVYMDELNVPVLLVMTVVSSGKSMRCMLLQLFQQYENTLLPPRLLSAGNEMLDSPDAPENAYENMYPPVMLVKSGISNDDRCELFWQM